MKRLVPNSILQDRYEIRKLIGKGGMGEVYLATDHRLGHSVALKRTTVGDDAMLAEAFEREARILAQLRHPALPKVSDHFIEDNEQFLVMDYIGGDDLSKILKSTKKPFPLNWVLFWADQLLQGLTYLHTNEPPIIHRDIKPQNLKLTEDNQVILLDFGLSKHSADQTRVTTSGSVVGYTPHYASMEQIRGTGTNARSDIYSLSATLYHLITNTVPPDALTRADELLAGKPDPIRPLTELNPEVSEAISDIILKGMEIRQENRFEVARDMQKDLRSAFNELQNSMSAETVAFNLDDSQQQEDDDDESDFNTEVMPSIPLDIGQDSGDSEISDSQNSNAVQEETLANVDYSGDQTEIIDPSQMQEISKEAGIDLEVGGEAKTKEQIETDYQTKENFETSDDLPSEVFETNEDISEAKDFAPEATVPLISVDDKALGTEKDEDSFVDNASEFESVSVSNEEQESFTETENFALTENFSSEESEAVETLDSQPEKLQSEGDVQDDTVTPPPPPKKSSTGKYLAILGGLGALLLLFVISAAGIGWYVTGGNFGGVFGGDTNTSTPTPESTVSQTPEQEVTPEITNTDTPTEDENVNTDVNSTNTDENSNTDNTNENVDNTNVSTNEPSKTPTGGSTPRATPKSTRSTRPTPKVTKTKRPTPKVTKTKRPTPKVTKTKRPTPRGGKDPGID